MQEWRGGDALFLLNLKKKKWSFPKMQIPNRLFFKLKFKDFDKGGNFTTGLRMNPKMKTNFY